MGIYVVIDRKKRNDTEQNVTVFSIKIFIKNAIIQSTKFNRRVDFNDRDYI
jgi:hypothetical protein